MDADHRPSKHSDRPDHPHRLVIELATPCLGLLTGPICVYQRSLAVELNGYGFTWIHSDLLAFELSHLCVWWPYASTALCVSNFRGRRNHQSHILN
jgi:hypothetical protein